MDDHAFGITQSLTGKRWVWRTRHEERVGQGLAQQLGMPELMGRLLAARGVSAEHVPDFLDPTLRAMLPDPSSIADMDAAAARLADAIMDGETIGVFGDYDVDGACSAALLVTLLRQLGCNVVYHVPDRILEGYGPNTNALRGMVERGARLLICVDCGTAAHAAFAPLHNTADILVFDHHKSEGPPPPIRATVNPNRLDCTSGLHNICAAAVTFIACVALLRALRKRGFFENRAEPDLREFLDLVALATVCDVMPLTGLNRAFVTQGLRVMARRARPGIAALLDVAKLTEAPNAMHCGFALGPRINASGRIAEADMGLRLLLAEDEVLAAELAQALGRGEPPATSGGGRHHLRRHGPGPGPGRGRARGHPARAGRVAPGRGRYCRGPGEGEVQPPCPRRRHYRGHGQGLRPLGSRHRPRRSGDRSAAERAAGHWRRPCDGGGVLGTRRRRWASCTNS